MYLFQVHKLQDSKLEGHEKNPSVCNLGYLFWFSLSFLMFYVWSFVYKNVGGLKETNLHKKLHNIKKSLNHIKLVL